MKSMTLVWRRKGGVYIRISACSVSKCALSFMNCTRRSSSIMALIGSGNCEADGSG